jgi:hypothetical protein
MNNHGDNLEELSQDDVEIQLMLDMLARQKANRDKLSPQERARLEQTEARLAALRGKLFADLGIKIKFVKADENVKIVPVDELPPDEMPPS